MPKCYTVTGKPWVLLALCLEGGSHGLQSTKPTAAPLSTSKRGAAGSAKCSPGGFSTGTTILLPACATKTKQGAASAGLATQVSGEVRVLLGGNVASSSTWMTVERNILLNNPNVTKITIINM
jgi:hypothetical protein